MIAHNILKQLGLWKYTEIPAVNRAYVPAYVSLLGLPVVLLVIQAVFAPSLWVSLLLAAAASLILLWSGRHVLAIHVMFPEYAAWAARRGLRQRPTPAS